ncbi:MAG: PAS domain S-box protein [Nitrospirota bacterium]
MHPLNDSRDYQVRVLGAAGVDHMLDKPEREATREKRASTAELKQKLRDRTQELAALDEVALTLSQAENLKDILDKSLIKIFECMEGLDNRGGIFLCDPKGKRLQLMVHQGLSEEFIQVRETLNLHECLCGKVMESGEVVYTEQECENLFDILGKPETQPHILVPIKTRGTVLGIIYLNPQEGFRFKTSDLQMLEIIGSQLGLAVENFRIYAKEKEASAKYCDLFENARDILCIVDSAGRITSANKAAELFTGYSRTELIDQDIRTLLTQKSAETVTIMMNSTVSSSVTEFEVIKRDATHAFVNVIARRLFADSIPSGFQISARDVTEQKILQQKLLKAERLFAIGQVGIAMRHEINNPLTTVIGNVELLLERFEKTDKEATARLEAVLNNALRIAEIIKRVEEIKKDNVVEYMNGVSMTDLKKEG